MFDAVNHVVVGLFGLAMAWYGAALARATWSNKIAVLDVPQGVSYLPIAIAGALIALFALEHLLALSPAGPIRPTRPRAPRRRWGSSRPWRP